MKNRIHVLTDYNIIAIFFILADKYNYNTDKIAKISNMFRYVLNNDESTINEISDIIERIHNDY